LSATPLLAYRWVDTDRALTDQLALEVEGHAATLSTGHAAVRFTNPTNGGDVLPTIRTEMHRIKPGAQTLKRREVGSSVYQVFDDRSLSVTICARALLLASLQHLGRRARSQAARSASVAR
jgi:gentisate 1,2-dioxygenase